MREMFPCGLFQPPGIKVFGVCDNAVLYGNNEIPFVAIDAINLMAAPTPMTNGVAQMRANGKLYQLVYKFSDRERAASALNYAKMKVEEAHGIQKNYKYFISAHTGTTLEVYDTYLVINFMRTGGLGTITANVYSGGATGGKRINFSDITAIQFKEPAGAVVGFIQFAYPGSREAHGGVIDAINDENSVPVSPQNLEVARAAVNYIEQRRVELRNTGGVVVQQVSAADEIIKFKNLLDMGVISQEEFDVKKNQILGIPVNSAPVAQAVPQVAPQVAPQVTPQVAPQAEVPAPAAAASKVYCTSCGTLNENARFCYNCGKQLQ